VEGHLAALDALGRTPRGVSRPLHLHQHPPGAAAHLRSVTRKYRGRQLGSDGRWVEALGDQPNGQDHLLHEDGKSQDELGRRHRLGKTQHDEDAGHHDQRDGHKAPG
jgi:hypothetical protein